MWRLSANYHFPFIISWLGIWQYCLYPADKRECILWFHKSVFKEQSTDRDQRSVGGEIFWYKVVEPVPGYIWNTGKSPAWPRPVWWMAGNTVWICIACEYYSPLISFHLMFLLIVMHPFVQFMPAGSCRYPVKLLQIHLQGSAPRGKALNDLQRLPMCKPALLYHFLW